ncbi:LON peptidase substrate-binding domain-containing protein [Oceanisphaera psychrotolerans]|uniref:ATP-dependent protease La n=1 Tax=Oceanisphaera psychrotolerans TaxID=1414654 RepID=A0A1J4QFG4_9GAMM|nr:LON peptidase substrate-binding domain-containing protein [Oceanisphaera psychrotolerans]OIN09581.1 ATP-dependent protease La [Oceanisphaera psychrotolerans]
MKLALLPLTLHLMPGGKVPLRIFEPRYIRMVTEASRSGTGFGIGMLDELDEAGHSDLFMLGIRVNIIDFYTLEGGLLGITVEAMDRFRIRQLEREADGLLRAEVDLLDNWRSCMLSPTEQVLSDKLQEVFAEYPEMSELHPAPQWRDAAWVAQRWLEVLPLKSQLTQQLMAEDSCHRALGFLMSMLTSPSQPDYRH